MPVRDRNIPSLPGSLRWLALLSVLVVVGAVAFVLGGIDWGREAADADVTGMFHPGSMWDGQGAGGISEAEAQQFDAFPLLWLGPTFGGFHLQSIIRQEVAPPAGVPAHEALDSVTFLYGECLIHPDAEACTGPLTLHVEPICMARPEWTATFGTTTTARGNALLRTFPDGHMRLWTGTISVSVNAVGNPALTRDAADQLTGLNPLAAAITPGSHLAAPDLSACPAVDIPPGTDAPTPSATATPV